MGASQSIIAQGPPIVAVEHEMKTPTTTSSRRSSATPADQGAGGTFAKELQRLMDKVAAFGEEKEEAARRREGTTAAPAAADAVAKEEKTASPAVVPAAQGHPAVRVMRSCAGRRWMATSRRLRRCSRGR